MWHKILRIEYPNVNSSLLNDIWSAVPFAKPFFRKQCRYEDHRGRVASEPDSEGRRGGRRDGDGAYPYLGACISFFIFVGI